MSRIEWGGDEDCAQTRRGLPPGISSLAANHSAYAAVQQLVETGLHNWSDVLDLQRRCGTVLGDAKDAARRLREYFGTRDEHSLMHAARLWLVLLCYEPPHAPIQSKTPAPSTPFVKECNDKSFLGTIQKLVNAKNLKRSPAVILRFVRIVATAANLFGGEFDNFRPTIEAKSPERVIRLFQPSDEIFYPTTGWADKNKRGRDGFREATDDDSAIGHPTLVVQTMESDPDYVVVERDQLPGGRPVSRERRTPEPEGLDPALRVELKMAREMGELVLHTLQQLSATHDLRAGGLPFNFITDMVQQCGTWKQKLSDYHGSGRTGTDHQRYMSESATTSRSEVGQIREFNEAVKALDDALDYYARLERGASPMASSGERHQRTATAPSSSTNARPSPRHHAQQTANQSLHVVTEHRPGRGQVPIHSFNERRGAASVDGHDRGQYQHSASPSRYQHPPSPTAASYHGHTNTLHEAASLDGHEYGGYRQQQSTQAPAGSTRPQPATWSRGQNGRR